ncbi:hypothetical protein [Vacuolonema iberomarrocanum]|uniref:hypothetical protein n=1 Tax=Vacuolonema iberomarrocanum TaxID=3454632 RepID=UPI0019ECD33C|nr:hypothetical protein [filamentous cyanobacterium LEGE 07170]
MSGLAETPLDVALDFALQTDLSDESRQELAGFVNYLNEQPERARAVAIETKIALLKVKEMYARTLGAIEASDLGWLDQWRLKQGEAIQGVGCRAKAEGLSKKDLRRHPNPGSPGLLPKPVRRGKPQRRNRA